MHLLENDYETAALLALPPNARDAAEDLLSNKPLSELLLMLENSNPSHETLLEHRISYDQWPQIVKAALLAKSTYFLPNKNFSRQQVQYLMKAAALAIDMPLDLYKVKDIVELQQDKYPVLVRWLKQMLILIQNKSS